MSTKTNLILDVTMFGAFLAVSIPHSTGTTVHEWLAVSLAGTVIAHLLFHWDWILKVGRDFFKKLWHQSRLNFTVDTLFFIAMTGALFSGLLISQSVLATFGIHLDVSRSWRSIHELLSDASLLLLGVHVALHWKWSVVNLNRYLLNPVRSLFQRPSLPQAFRAQPMQIERNK